jgi:peptidoglycan hydrolase-like protein with peptidoglycan-binding domain
MKKIQTLCTFACLLLITSAAIARDLKEGMKGEDVKQWQLFLIRQGYMKPPALGNFSKRTRQATTAFQKRHGLPTVGVVGSQTLAKARGLGFNQTVAIQQRSAKPFSVADCETAAILLRNVKKGSTLAKLKKLLPRSTKYYPYNEFSYGEHVQGNVIKFVGKATGYFVFLSPRQRELLQDGFSDTPEFRSRLRYKLSDPISVVHVVVGYRQQNSKATSFARIDAASRYLGKPKEKVFHAEPRDPLGIQAFADWKLSGSRRVYFSDAHILGDGYAGEFALQLNER